jgi:molybdopterin synthase catalytic subunit
VIALLGIRDEPFDAAEVLEAVADPTAGGVVSFTGLVRAEDEGRAVTALEYTAHPGAEAELERVAAAVLAETGAVRVAALHRVGRLEIGDVAVVVAASAAHRDEAFVAARRLIDDLKATVPIWKDQHFVDGSHEWVGLP